MAVSAIAAACLDLQLANLHTFHRSVASSVCHDLLFGVALTMFFSAIFIIIIIVFSYSFIYFGDVEGCFAEKDL